MTRQPRHVLPESGTPRWWALLLLAGLLAHLLMMASPMHGSRIAYAAEMGAPSAEAAEHATHGGTISTPMPHLDASEHRHGGHCGIEWMAARPTPSTVLLLDIAAPVTVLDLPQIAPSPRDAHATGPPLHGDLQARLQVFRL